MFLPIHNVTVDDCDIDSNTCQEQVGEPIPISWIQHLCRLSKRTFLGKKMKYTCLNVKTDYVTKWSVREDWSSVSLPSMYGTAKDLKHNSEDLRMTLQFGQSWNQCSFKMMLCMNACYFSKWLIFNKKENLCSLKPFNLHFWSFKGCYENPLEKWSWAKGHRAM
jgi:hypothetical protein